MDPGDFRSLLTRGSLLAVLGATMAGMLQQAILCQSRGCEANQRAIGEAASTVLLGAPGDPVRNIGWFLFGLLFSLAIALTLDWRGRVQGPLTIGTLLLSLVIVLLYRPSYVFDTRLVYFVSLGTGAFIPAVGAYLSFKGQTVDPQTFEMDWVSYALVVTLGSFGLAIGYLGLSRGQLLGVFTLIVLGVYLWALWAFFIRTSTIDVAVVGSTGTAKSHLLMQVMRALRETPLIKNTSKLNSYPGFPDEELTTSDGTLVLTELEQQMDELDLSDPFPYADTKGVTPMGVTGILGTWFPERFELQTLDHDGEVANEVIRRFRERDRLRDPLEYYQMKLLLKLGKTFEVVPGGEFTELASVLAYTSKKECIAGWLYHRVRRSDMVLLPLDVSRVVAEQEAHKSEVATMANLIGGTRGCDVFLVPTKTDVWIHESPVTKQESYTIEELGQLIKPAALEDDLTLETGSSLSDWFRPVDASELGGRDSNPIYQSFEEYVTTGPLEGIFGDIDSEYLLPTGYETEPYEAAVPVGPPSEEDGTMAPNDTTALEDGDTGEAAGVHPTTSAESDTASLSSGGQSAYRPIIRPNADSTPYTFHGNEQIVKLILNRVYQSKV